MSNINTSEQPIVIDTYDDFHKIIDGQILESIDNEQFVWNRVSNGKIVGKISTFFRSCPCVEVDIYVLHDDGKCNYHYTSVTDNEIYCSIQQYDEKIGTFVQYDFCSNVMNAGVLTVKLHDSFRICAINPCKYTELIIDDDGGMV